MALYEYECSTHGRYEVTQRITDAALTNCSVGGCAEPVRKLISSTSFAIKGSGWQANDCGSSSGNAAPSACGGGGCSTGNCPALA